MLGRIFAWFERKPRRTTLTCMRLADMAVVHPQMTAGYCSGCLRPVGIYPSGQRVIKQRGERVDVVCHVCRPAGGAQPAPGALAEVGQSVPRR